MGENDAVISIEHVSKKYCKRLKRSLWYGVQDLYAALRGHRTRSDRLRREEFLALQDVSLEVRRGETLGIVGPNGSGKTTLLKMINGILFPDAGRVSVSGRVGALIAVGAGFHPMLTGRENIYINAAIMGLTKRQIEAKFSAIVAFADIGDFLDMPVMNYSSGMFVRLGFAVAIHCDPDILLVDEVLSVGDVGFRLKCINRIKSMMRDGLTTLFVSHNMDTVNALCDRAVALDNGTIAAGPDTPDVVLAHNQALFARRRLCAMQDTVQESVRQNAAVEITGVDLLDRDGNSCDVFAYDEPFRVRIRFAARERIDNPSFGLEIKREDGVLCWLDRSNYHGFHLDCIEGDGSVEMVLQGLFLGPMNYATRAVITESSVSLTLTSRLGPRFTVTSPIPYMRDGVCFPQAVWRAGLEPGER